MKTKNIMLVMGLVLGILLFLISNVTAAQNPAAIYCKEMGYNYNLENTASGQEGFCNLPDKTKCDEWKFFNGDCGKKYSYCSKKGYTLKLNINDSDPLLKKIPTCLIPNDKQSKYIWIFKIKQGYDESSVISLMNITNKIINKANNKFPTIPTNINSKSIKSLSTPILGTDLCDGVHCDPSQDNATHNNQCDPETGRCVIQPRISPVFNWRNYNGSNWMTPVKNQGTCGSCYIFSTLGAIESKFQIELHNPLLSPDLSEQHYLSCNSFGEGCDGGWMGNVADFAESNGLLKETDYAYTGNKAACSLPSNWEYKVNNIESYSRISLANELELRDIIKISGPVIAHIPSWDHAIVLTGWNSTSDLFYFKNSWGTGWGDGGYGTIAWNLFDNSSFIVINETSKCYNINCDDSNNYTLDSCYNQQCSHQSIRCFTNFDCNDNNSATRDTCHISGTVQSYCTNTNLTIASWSDLNSIRNDLSASYSLIANLSSSSPDYLGIGNNWQSIIGFTGSFNGQGNIISNLVITGSFMNAGLFVYLLEPSTKISNLGLKDVIFNTTREELFAGAITGYNAGTIENSYASGISKSIGKTGGHGEHGGLVGTNAGNIFNSYFSGVIESTESHLGGLVGSNTGNGQIINSYSTGVINNSPYSAGGIAGLNGGNITNSYSTLKISGGLYIGGIVGENRGNIKNCGWWIGSGPANPLGNSFANITYNEINQDAFFNKSHGVYSTNAPHWDFTTPIWYEWSNDYPKFTNEPPIPTFNLEIVMGWNSINFTVLPEDRSLFNVLSSISGKYSQVKTQDSEGNILMWDETLPDFANDLTEINYNQTYMINMKENATIIVQGYS